LSFRHATLFVSNTISHHCDVRSFCMSCPSLRVTAECREPLAAEWHDRCRREAFYARYCCNTQSKREHRRSFHADSSTMDGIVYRTTLPFIYAGMPAVTPFSIAHTPLSIISPLLFPDRQPSQTRQDPQTCLINHLRTTHLP